MKYIKAFESFNVNETMDMFMMPVDPIKGAAEVWSDILDSLWEGIQKFYKGAKEYFTEGLDKICDFAFKMFANIEDLIKKIELYFKSPVQDLTYKQVFDILMKKNADLVKESRESEMEEYSEKNVSHKVATILQGILGYNAVGGLLVVIVQWISENALNFDLLGWANSLGLPDAMSNIGSRGFIPSWMIVSLVAIAIIAIIKRADAYLATDKGIAGKLYKPFG